MNRYKPVGWRNESYRHFLAAKGVSTKKDFFQRRSEVLEGLKRVDENKSRNEYFRTPKRERYKNERHKIYVYSDVPSRQTLRNREDSVKLLEDRYNKEFLDIALEEAVEGERLDADRQEKLKADKHDYDKMEELTMDSLYDKTVEELEARKRKADRLREAEEYA